MKKLNIAVDFDDTIFLSNYPRIGKLILKAKEAINQWHNEGYLIVINTCRAGKELEAAKQALFDNGVHFDFINENNPELIKKYGTDTRKISADIYIDDKNVERIDWETIKRRVKQLSLDKKRIICIVGESGTGKTTLAEFLEQEFSIQNLNSYTTRPRRAPDETGHIFVSEQEFDEFKQEDMLAYTEFGGYRYCCLNKDLKEWNIYVIDEDGLNCLRNNTEHLYYTIRLKASNESLIKRGISQERIDRDKGRFNLPDQSFDMVLHDLSIEETQRKASSFIQLAMSYSRITI